MKILLIDDSEKDRSTLESLFRSRGYEVNTAHDGRDALREIGRERYDIVVSGILMPHMDGFQLCREMCRRGLLRETMFVFYGGAGAESAEKPDELSLGSALFLRRPARPEDLVAFLDEAVARRDSKETTGKTDGSGLRSDLPDAYGGRLLDTLERKIRELEAENQDLYERQTRYQDVVENMDDAVVMLDERGSIVLANRQFCEMVGCLPEDVNGLDWTGMIHPEDRWKMAELLRDLPDARVLRRTLDMRLLKRDGEVIGIETRITGIVKEDTVQRVLSVIRARVDPSNVETERRKISERRQTLENIINRSPAVVFLCRGGEEWIAEFISESIRQFGYEPEDFYSRSIKILDVIHPDDRGTFVKRLMECERQAMAECSQEFRIVTRFGAVRWIDGRILIRRDQFGQVSRYQGVGVDITRQKRAEERSRMLSQTIRCIDDCVVICDAFARVIFANKAFLETYGYTKADIEGRHLRVLFQEEIEPGLLRQITERGWQGEIVQRRRNGETFPSFVSTSVIREEDGSPMAVVMVSRNLTDFNRAEIERKKLQAQLLQSQKMEAIGTLAGGVAHDFNNLLSAIHGYSELLMESLDEESENYVFAREIHRASVRGADLTRQLLLFGRKQPMEMVPMCINRMVEDMTKMLRRFIGEDIRLITELAKELDTVKADPARMEQVLMNLVINARDAMPNGGTLTIRTEGLLIGRAARDDSGARRRRRYVCLSVSDTGEGMDKETMRRIFEPFFSTKGPNRGTGLGLPVVYGIVEAHGGWIDVRSKPGEGATFAVYLPALKGGPLVVEKESDETYRVRGKGERILVVEDEASIQNLNVRALKAHGYMPFAATSAREALEIFDRERGNFAMVFSDVILPDDSGLNLAEELRARNPDLRILLSSGYSEERAPLKTIQERGFLFLQKPYGVARFLRAIRDVLDRGELPRGRREKGSSSAAESASREAGGVREHGREEGPGQSGSGSGSQDSSQSPGHRPGIPPSADAS